MMDKGVDLTVPFKKKKLLINSRSGYNNFGKKERLYKAKAGCGKNICSAAFLIKRVVKFVKEFNRSYYFVGEFTGDKKPMMRVDE